MTNLKRDFFSLQSKSVINSRPLNEVLLRHFLPTLKHYFSFIKHRPKENLEVRPNFRFKTFDLRVEMIGLSGCSFSLSQLPIWCKWPNKITAAVLRQHSHTACWIAGNFLEHNSVQLDFGRKFWRAQVVRWKSMVRSHSLANDVSTAHECHMSTC